MKPVVSVLNAWSWYAFTKLILYLLQTDQISSQYSAIISLFAIVILSVLGSLYKVRLLPEPLPDLFA